MNVVATVQKRLINAKFRKGRQCHQFPTILCMSTLQRATCLAPAPGKRPQERGSGMPESRIVCENLCAFKLRLSITSRPRQIHSEQNPFQCHDCVQSCTKSKKASRATSKKMLTRSFQLSLPEKRAKASRCVFQVFRFEVESSQVKSCVP